MKERKWEREVAMEKDDGADIGIGVRDAELGIGNGCW